MFQTRPSSIAAPKRISVGLMTQSLGRLNPIQRTSGCWACFRPNINQGCHGRLLKIVLKIWIGTLSGLNHMINVSKQFDELETLRKRVGVHVYY